MGKCCVVGASSLTIDEARGSCESGDLRISEGDWVTVDGTSGRVLIGQVATVEPEFGEEFHRLMVWADATRVLRVRTNADTPTDARKGREYGAEGIGLCRTEHMFFEGERIHAVRAMILAETPAARRAALAELLPMQRADFEGIFRAMDGYPVTIRLLDPPLHEFLPGPGEVDHFARRSGMSPASVARIIDKHREQNPMLGHRGVRLSISYPEIAEMQTRAIVEAAVSVAKDGVRVQPEIMVPLVADERELALQRELITRVASDVFTERGISIHYLIGTMIELPRAALMAADIARQADFFSFGTNDLTQTTFGISRDDAATFLPRYVELGILDDDPFQVLDREGVGQLVQLATWEGRKRRHDLKVGICGEHGGEPASVAFFHEAGLDYVSCSPFRVPIARLAAAHAALQDERSSRKLAEQRVLRAESHAAEATLGMPRAVPAD
jgi:pyruvate, orthophosphate dikinase